MKEISWSRRSLKRLDARIGIQGIPVSRIIPTNGTVLEYFMDKFISLEEKIEDPAAELNEHLFLQDKPRYELNDMLQYAQHNLDACTNPYRFAKYLNQQGIPYVTYTTKRDDFKYHNGNCEFIHEEDLPKKLFEYYLDKDVFECLEPIWSVFYKRFNELFYHSNYDLGDPSKPFAEQTEITVLKCLKYVKNGKLIDIYTRNGENAEWEQMDTDVYGDYNTQNLLCDFTVKHLFFYMQNKVEVAKSHRFIRSVAALALADVFNQYDTLYERSHVLNNTCKAFNEILDVFITRLTHDYDSKIEKTYLNPFYVKPFETHKRFRKICAVLAALLDEEICKVYYASAFDKHDYQLKLSDYNSLCEQYGGMVADLKRWRSENPVKEIYLLTMTSYQDREELIKSTDAFSYSKILFKHNPKKSYPFYDKRAYQGFLKHGKPKMMLAFNKLTEQFGGKMISKHFLMMTYWLGYTRFKKINQHILAHMIDCMAMMHTNHRMNYEDFLPTYSNAVYALDLLYERLLQEWNKDKKPSAFRRNSESAELQEIIDFITCEDGNAPSNLNRFSSKTTLRSMLRLSHEWHIQVQMAEYKRERKDYPHLLPYSQTIGKHSFSLIHNDFDLYKEGLEMHHCIDSFHSTIATGHYLAFQVMGESERATLGIRVLGSHTPPQETDLYGRAAKQPKPSRKLYLLDQCYRSCNADVSEALLADAQQLVLMLNKGDVVVEKQQSAA